MATKHVAGAGARVFINGVEIGSVSGVDVTIQITQIPAEVLGTIDPVEYVPNDRKVSGTASFLHIPEQSLHQQGIMPMHTTDAKADTISILNQAPMTWALFNVATDETIFTIIGVKPSSGGYTVQRGDIIRTNFSFVATGVRDDLNS